MSPRPGLPQNDLGELLKLNLWDSAYTEDDVPLLPFIEEHLRYAFGT